MKDFNARTEGLNNARLADTMFDTAGNVDASAELKPGTLLLMDSDGLFGLLGETTVDLSNKHMVYYCNSWADSASAKGNGMVSVIPITQQFEYEVTFDKTDSALDDDASFVVGDLLCITGGKLTEAGDNDYVMGSVKAGSCTQALGGTITVVTWGADFVIPAAG